MRGGWPCTGWLNAFVLGYRCCCGGGVGCRHLSHDGQACTLAVTGALNCAAVQLQLSFTGAITQCAIVCGRRLDRVGLPPAPGCLKIVRNLTLEACATPSLPPCSGASTPMARDVQLWGRPRYSRTERLWTWRLRAMRTCSMNSGPRYPSSRRWWRGREQGAMEHVVRRAGWGGLSAHCLPALHCKAPCTTTCRQCRFSW